MYLTRALWDPYVQVDFIIGPILQGAWHWGLLLDGIYVLKKW